MSMQVESYTKVPASRMLYSRSPVVLDSLSDRRPDRFFPVTGRTANPGDTVQFEISSDSFLDCLSSFLTFDLAFTGGTGHEISGAYDIVSRVEIFYNDTLLERITEANAWANSFIAMTANQTWLQAEGSVLGIKNQFLNNGVAAAADNGARRYILPLSLVSGFFRCPSYIPIVGNKLKVNIVLAQPKEVIIKSSSATATYALSNISLSADVVVANQKHRDAIIQAMRADTIRIPFTTYQTGSLQAYGSTENYLKISNNNSNALSLHLLYNNQSDKTQDSSSYVMYNQSFPLSTFSRLRVRSGTKNFTPADDIQGHAELYASANKCVSSFNDLSGSGVVPFTVFKAGYTKDVDNVDPTKYGLCLISTNLEKSLDSDDSAEIINNGASANEGGMTSDIDVYLTTTSNLNAADNFLYNIVHKRNLVMKQGSVVCEF